MQAQLETFDTAEGFLARTQADLARQEAANNLILGLAMHYGHNPERYPNRPYLAAVTQAGVLRLAALMTPPRALHICLAAENDAEACELVIRNLRERGWRVSGVNGRVPTTDLFARLWTLASGAPHHVKLDLRVYELRHVQPVGPASGRIRAAARADLESLTPWVVRFQDEALDERVDEASASELLAMRIRGGDVYVWDDGGPVSMAVRLRPTLTGICIGGVYTPPELRGRGYASAVVASLSQRCLDEGYRFCMLFTDLANVTSNSIYQKIGYRAVCDFREYEFG